LAHRPIITLTTDFGTNDHFVGAVKGVILDIVPGAAIVDISHAVQAFDLLDGAIAISQTYSYFPTGTVHTVVVDPGVGTTGRPIIALSDGYHHLEENFMRMNQKPNLGSEVKLWVGWIARYFRAPAGAELFS